MKKYSIIKNNYMSTNLGNLGNKVIKAHKCLAHSFRGFLVTHMNKYCSILI